jgi:hypothetical protein
VVELQQWLELAADVVAVAVFNNDKRVVRESQSES